MNPKKAKSLLIIVSLIIAIAMIISSYFLADTGHSQTAVFILIAIWWIPFTYLTRVSKRKSDD
jgi:hypothetical protein